MFYCFAGVLYMIWKNEDSALYCFHVGVGDSAKPGSEESISSKYNKVGLQ